MKEEQKMDETEFQALLLEWAKAGHLDKHGTSYMRDIETSFEHAADISENYIHSDSCGSYYWAGFTFRIAPKSYIEMPRLIIE